MKKKKKTLHINYSNGTIIELAAVVIAIAAVSHSLQALWLQKWE